MKRPNASQVYTVGMILFAAIAVGLMGAEAWMNLSKKKTQATPASAPRFEAIPAPEETPVEKQRRQTPTATDQAVGPQAG